MSSLSYFYPLIYIDRSMFDILDGILEKALWENEKEESLCSAGRGSFYSNWSWEGINREHLWVSEAGSMDLWAQTWGFYLPWTE